jgi:hypothetical protein
VNDETPVRNQKTPLYACLLHGNARNHRQKAETEKPPFSERFEKLVEKTT